MDNVFFDRMEKLRKEDYIRTFFTCAEMRPEDPRSDQVVRCILPVDVYEKDGWGYEIMPVRILAAHCPWDLKYALVKIKTENTNILGNLHDIMIEDKELHKHLEKLEGSE